jgi:hypothetical protein
MEALLTRKLTDDGESLPLANFATSLRVAFMKFVTIRVHSRPFVVGFLSAFICGWISFVSCIYELC